MLNVIVFLYVGGFSFEYAYNGNQNIITIKDRTLTKNIEKKLELFKICENDKIESIEDPDVIQLIYSPYVRS